LKGQPDLHIRILHALLDGLALHKLLNPEQMINEDIEHLIESEVKSWLRTITGVIASKIIPTCFMRKTYLEIKTKIMTIQNNNIMNGVLMILIVAELLF
jgi:hypothetical protein